MSKKYIFKNKNADKFNKHGIDLTIFQEGVESANVVEVDVKEGHFQEFKDKSSTYIYYIFEGKGTFVIDGKNYEAKAGDLAVIPPNTRIHYFGKMKMSLTVTPAFNADNEVHVRFVDKSESPYEIKDPKYLLILHGINGEAGSYWQSWLASEMNKEGFEIIMPTLPNAKKPNRQEWIEAIQESIETINDLSKLDIVAHSLGVPAGLDFLETLDKRDKINSFISVAGFYEPYGLELNEEYMQAKAIDIKSLISKAQRRVVVRSLNDPYVDQEALINLGKDWKADEIIIRQGKHFQHDGYIERFELIKTLLLN